MNIIEPVFLYKSNDRKHLFPMMTVNVIYDRKQRITVVNAGIDDHHRLPGLCVINLRFKIKETRFSNLNISL